MASDVDPSVRPRLDRTGPFVEGDKVQLSDHKGRMNTITLKANTLFHSHRGYIRHDDLIGQPDGTVIENSAGQILQAMRPLYNDYMMAMPRGAAIIYPKDSAHILMYGDVFPGSRVLEAGVGSGGLTIALLRAIGPTGSLRSIERREDFAAVAEANVTTYFGETPAWWELSVGDFQDAAASLAAQQERVDRVMLDMLAPWECVDQAADVLEDGGVFLAYIATVTQMSRTVEALRDHGEFMEPEAWETIMRPWHLDGLAVRPVHRMNSHTGFLLTARRTARGCQAVRRRQRLAPGSRDEAELNHPANEGFGGSQNEWTPADFKERNVAVRKSKRALRDITQGRNR